MNGFCIEIGFFRPQMFLWKILFQEKAFSVFFFFRNRNETNKYVKKAHENQKRIQILKSGLLDGAHDSPNILQENPRLFAEKVTSKLPHKRKLSQVTTSEHSFRGLPKTSKLDSDQKNDDTPEHSFRGSPKKSGLGNDQKDDEYIPGVSEASDSEFFSKISEESCIFIDQFSKNKNFYPIQNFRPTFNSFFMDISGRFYPRWGWSWWASRISPPESQATHVRDFHKNETRGQANGIFTLSKLLFSFFFFKYVEKYLLTCCRDIICRELMSINPAEFKCQELWHSNSWISSIRITSGRYAHYSDGLSIFFFWFRGA